MAHHLSTRKPDLDDGIREEIEVLIEEHRRLVDAAKEETGFQSRDSGGANPWKTEESMQRNDKETNVEEVNGQNQSEDENGCDEEGVEISVDSFFSSVDNSIDKIMKSTTASEQKKHSYFSHASKMIGYSFKARQDDHRNSPPPPLSLATTFDTTTTLDTEPSSVSEEEYRDRDSNSTTGRDSYQDRILVSHVKEFSRLSSTDIATIMEEQQQKREQIKKADVEREQEELDEGLHQLQDESESGTDVSRKGNGALEWLEAEVEHNEMVSEIVSEMNEGDGKSSRDHASDESGDDVAATHEDTALAKGPRTRSRERRFSHLKRYIRFEKKSGKTSFTVPFQQRAVVLGSQDDPVGEAEILVGTTDNRESLQPEQGQESSSSSLVGENATVPESEEAVRTQADQEQEIMNASPPLSHNRNSVRLPAEAKPGEQEKEAISSTSEEEKAFVVRSDNNTNDAAAEGGEEEEEESEPMGKSTCESVEIAIGSTSSTHTNGKTSVIDIDHILRSEEIVEPVSLTPPTERIVPLLEEIGHAGPSIEDTDNELSLRIEEKQSFILEGEDIANATLEEAGVAASSPSIRHSIQVQQEDRELLDQRERKLSISELLSFDDHPEARGAGPIDLDQVHDHVEQVKETQTEVSMTPQTHADSSLCVPRDEQGDLQSLPVILSSPSHPKEVCDDETTSSSGSSCVEQLKEAQNEGPVCLPNHPDSGLRVPEEQQRDPDSSPVTRPLSSFPKTVSDDSPSSASMIERNSKKCPSGVRGSFLELKHIVIVAMMCVVVGIGVTTQWFDLQSQTDTGSLPELANVMEEAPKRNSQRKKRKEKPNFDIDELLDTLL